MPAARRLSGWRPDAAADFNDENDDEAERAKVAEEKREEAEKRGKLIKAASDRHAPPDEACKLIRNFSQSETKMIKYIEAHAAKCGIPPQVGAQMKDGHKNTEAMAAKVCNVALQMQQQQARPAGPSLSEVLGSGSAPEVNAGKKGGSTFDTLNGNVLTR